MLLTITSCNLATPPVVGGPQPKELPSTAIPFLYYVQLESRIAAQLAYWEPNTGDVFFTNEKVYSVHAASHDVFPRAWDGAGWLVLAGSQTAAPGYTEAVADTDWQVGHHALVRCNRATDGSRLITSYTLRCYGSDAYDELDLKPTFPVENWQAIRTQPLADVPCVAHFDRETDQLTLAFAFWKEQVPNADASVLVATLDINHPDSVTWNEFTVPGTMWPRLIGTGKSILVGSKLYFESGIDLGALDLSTGEADRLVEVASVCRQLADRGNFEAPFPELLQPVACYDDILVAALPQYTVSGRQNIYCAVRDGRFIGAIRVLETGEWQIIDGRGEPLSGYVVPDGEQALKELVFPGY